MKRSTLTGLAYWTSFLATLRTRSGAFDFIPETLPNLPWAWLWAGKYLLCIGLAASLTGFLQVWLSGGWLAFPFLFYGIELPLVFFFPAVLASGSVWTGVLGSVQAARQMGWFRLYIRLLPLGFRMGWGFLFGRDPEAAWRSGCIQVFEWYGIFKVASRV